MRYKNSIMLKFLIAIVLFFISIRVGYSVLNQKLSINGSVDISQTSDTDYNITHDLYKVKSEDLWRYNYTSLITYKGEYQSNSWKITIQIPEDATLDETVFFTGCEYNLNGNILVLRNDLYTGIISKDELIKVSFGFITKEANYNINVLSVNFYDDNNPNPDYIQIPGKYEISIKDEHESNGKYIVYYTIVLYNNSEYDFYKWDFKIPFDVNSMKVTNHLRCEYIIKNNELNLFSIGIPSKLDTVIGLEISYNSKPSDIPEVISFMGSILKK